MNAVLLLALLSTGGVPDSPKAAVSPGTSVVLIVGAQGTEAYGREFAAWAGHWQNAAKRGRAQIVTIGQDDAGKTADRKLVEQALQAEVGQATGELWIVLIGHGTFDGRTPKFNLRGPDISADEFADWLKPITRPVAFINCSSSSGPFLNRLSHENRVVVTATKSGFEQNYSRFGGYFSAAIGDVAADLDKDGQTSLLEAYLTAVRQTEEFYTTEGRLATEHALLDDNGDKQGTRADFFRGIRPIKKAAEGAALDGYRAHQFHLVRSAAEQQLSPENRQQRDRLELAVIRLRDRKAEFREDEYYQQLETLLLGLAELYERAESQEEATATDAAPAEKPAPPAVPVPVTARP